MYKSKTGFTKAIRKTVLIHPLMQDSLTHPLDQDEKSDPLLQAVRLGKDMMANPLGKAAMTEYVGHRVITGPLEQSMTDNLRQSMSDNFGQSMSDNFGQSVKTDTLKQSAMNDSSGPSEKTKTSEQYAMADPLKQVMADTTGQAVMTKPLGYEMVTDPYKQAVMTDPLRQEVMTDPIGQAVMTDLLKQDVMTKPIGQDVTIKPSRQGVVNTVPLDKVVMTDPLGKAIKKDLNRQSGATAAYTGEIAYIQPVGQLLVSDPETEDNKINLMEQSSTSSMKHRTNKFTPRSGKQESTSKTNASKGTIQMIDFPQFKLSNVVDIQQLLNLGYRNPELIPLVKRISVINEIFGNFNHRAQSELVSIIKIVERTIKEFVRMKQTAYNSDAMQDAVYKLLPKLSKRFCGVVLKQGSFILDPAMRNLVEWNKISKNLPKKKRNSKNLFDLSCHFQTKDLIEIGNDHPEFKANIKTIIGVSAAMKHLNHDGQVEIYRIIRRMEKIIKDLVEQKINPDGCHDIFLTPETLTSSLDYCIEKILKYLKSSPDVAAKCFQCELDRGYVRNADIKPNIGTLTRPRAKQSEVHPENRMSVFDWANWGVSHDRINNLESLIHHLVARESILEDVWAVQNCVDWLEIASLYFAYRTETVQDLTKVKTLRRRILVVLEKVENILVEARSFCDEMTRVKFTKNDNLSDAIALSGQIGMLSSEVEHYLKEFNVLTEVLFGLLKEYGVASMNLRDNRLFFLTKSQWRAFNFPFLNQTM